jgi:hypothetical protein
MMNQAMNQMVAQMMTRIIWMQYDSDADSDDEFGWDGDSDMPDDSRPGR